MNELKVTVTISPGLVGQITTGVAELLKLPGYGPVAPPGSTKFPPHIGGATVVEKFLTIDQGLTLSASQIVLT